MLPITVDNSQCDHGCGVLKPMLLQSKNNAVKRSAVEQLLIGDTLFVRSQDVRNISDWPHKTVYDA